MSKSNLIVEQQDAFKSILFKTKSEEPLTTFEAVSSFSESNKTLIGCLKCFKFENLRQEFNHYKRKKDEFKNDQVLLELGFLQNLAENKKIGILLEVVNSSQFDGFYIFGENPIYKIRTDFEVYTPFQALPDEMLSVRNNHINVISKNNTFERTFTQVKEEKEEVEKNVTSLIQFLTEHLETIFPGNISLPQHLKNGAISSIISSLVACSTSTLTMMYADMGVGLKILNSTNVVSSLINLAYQIHNVCITWNINFDIKKVLQEIPSMATNMYSTLQSNAASDILAPAISCICAIIIAGSTLFGVTDVRNVIQLGSLSKATRTLTTDVKEVVNFVLQDLFKLDYTGDSALYNDLIQMARRSSELIVKPVYEFIQNGELYQELHNFPNQVLEKVTKKFSDKNASQVVISAKNMLSTNLTQITELIKAIKIITDQKNRIETLAVLFAGQPAVGKSSFVHYIKDHIAQLLQLPKKMYNLDKSGGFCLPYGGEAFGLYNEFLGAGLKNDDFLPSFNSVISGDPANFESAHLAGKVQPVMLKTVFLTSNNINPNLVGPDGITYEAAQAVWSRTLRFELKDPKNPTRMSENPHRKKDFSHLTISFVKFNEFGQKIETSVSVKEVIHMIVQQMIIREVNFLKTLEEFHLPECETRKAFLENLIKPKANSKTKEFFVVRIQGAAGTMKTCFSERMSQVYESHLRIPVVKLKNFTQETEERAIFLVDDLVLTLENKREYFSWINKISPGSIVIIVTNEEIKRQSSLLMSSIAWAIGDNKPYYYKVQEELPSGYSRRIGLSGVVYHNEEKIINRIDTQHTITSVGNSGFSYQGINLSEDNIINTIFSSYLNFIKTTQQIIFLDTTYTGCINPTISIEANTLEDLMSTLNDVGKMYQSYTRNDLPVKIKVDPKFSKTVFGKTTPSEWKVPKNIKTSAELEALMKRMVVGLLKLNPAAEVELKIKELGSLVYTKGIIYRGFKPPCASTFTFLNGVAYFMGTAIQPEEYAQYIVQNHFSENLSQIPCLVLQEFTHKLTTLEDKVKILYSTAIKILELETRIPTPTKILINQLKKNKLIWISAGLIAATGFGAVLHNLFKRKTKNVHSNSCDDEDHAIKKWQDDFVTALHSGNREMIKRIRAEAEAEGLIRNLNQFEADIRSNAKHKKIPTTKENLEMVKRVFRSDNEQLIYSVIKDYPEEIYELMKTQSNSLTKKDEATFVTPTLLDNFKNKLLRNYVTISTQYGTCFGLCLKEDKLITVSHIFKDTGDKAIVRSDGKMYEAEVCKIIRSRDLAYVNVIDKAFPPARDITSSFIKQERFEDTCESYFIRVSPTDPLIAKCEIEYLESCKFNLTDTDNPLMDCDRKLINVDFAKANQMDRIIRNGDCGLPIIGIFNNECKILGIHNAKLGRMCITFASFWAEDLQVAKANSYDKIEKEKWFVKNLNTQETMGTNPEYFNRLVKFEPTKFSNLKQINVFAYNSHFNIYSNPTHKKNYHKLVGARTQCETLPSALCYYNWMDDSSLIKDKFGKPHTLMTQATKYGIYTEQYGKWDKNILTRTTDFLKFLVNKDFPNLRKLKTSEILNGIGRLKPFDLTTSAGPFFKLKYGLTNKEKIFSKIEKENFSRLIVSQNEYGKEFSDQLEHYSTCIKNGVPIFVLSKDNAKVEMLPKEKVQKGKVRLFNEIDVAINAVLKKYFGFLISQIEEKEDHTFCIGANHYVLATIIMKNFDLIRGDIQSTDYSNLDKSVCKELIEAFVEICCQYTTKLERQALTKTLCHTLHTLDGHLYYVDHGNESGSFVTTLLNCVVVSVVDVYAFIYGFEKNFKRFPSNQEIFRLMKRFVLGDDAIIKVDPNIVNYELRKEVASLFNMNLTPAKTDSKLPSFCSREFIKHANVYFPRLKKTSITSCLYYFETETKEQISSNINVALFEASLWDEDFFLDIQHDCFLLAKKYNIHQANWYSYADYQDCLLYYINSGIGSPTLTAVGVAEDKIKNNSLYILYQTNKMDASMVLNNYIQTNKLEPPTYLFYKQGSDDKPIWNGTVVFFDVFKNEFREGAVSTTKQEVKQKLCAQLVENLFKVRGNSDKKHQYKGFQFSFMKEKTSNLHVLTLDCQGVLLRFTHRTLNKCIKDMEVFVDSKFPSTTNEHKIKEFVNILQIRLNLINKPICIYGGVLNEGLYQHYGKELTCLDIDGFVGTWFLTMEDMSKDLALQVQSYKGIKKGTISYWIQDKLYFENVIDVPEIAVKANSNNENYKVKKYTLKGEEYIILDPFDRFVNGKKVSAPTIKICANSSPMNVEYGSANSEAVYASKAALPHGNENPQPTAMIPALPSRGEDMAGALEQGITEDFNQIMAPCTLPVGGITMNIFDLVYQQKMDSGVEIVTTNSAPSGTIVFQIPYDVNSKFVNKYIKALGSLHERFCGAFIFRIEVIGNPIYSGAIAIGWLPNFTEGLTVDQADAMRFAYVSKGVTANWTTNFLLHDARKDHFYRTVQDSSDVATRPHLIGWVRQGIVNPFGESATIRFRISCRLAGSESPDPFLFANPVVAGSSSSAITQQFQPLTTLFPSLTHNSLKIYTDGTLNHESIVQQGTAYYPNFCTFNTCINNWFGTNFAKKEGGPVISWPQSNGKWYQEDDKTWSQKFLQITTNIATEKLQQIFNNFGVTPELIFMAQTLMQDLIDPKKWIGNTLVSISKLVAPGSIIDYETKTYHYKRFVEQSFKFTTLYGTMLVNLIENSVDPGTETQTPDEFLATPYSTLGYGELLPTFNTTNIESDIQYLSGSVDYLPTGYVSLQLTDVPPSSITISQMNLPTASLRSDILAWLQTFETKIGETVEFEFIDLGSYERLFVARLLPETNQLVMKADSVDVYKVLPVSNQNIGVRWGSVLRTAQFAETNTSKWVSRTSPNFSKMTNLFKATVPNVPFKANAMAAAATGAIAGGANALGNIVGSGINAWNSRALQENQNKFSKEQNEYDRLLKQHLQSQQLSNNLKLQYLKSGTEKFINNSNIRAAKFLQNQSYIRDLANYKSKADIDLENSFKYRGWSNRVKSMPSSYTQ